MSLDNKNVPGKRCLAICSIVNYRCGFAQRYSPVIHWAATTDLPVERFVDHIGLSRAQPRSVILLAEWGLQYFAPVVEKGESGLSILWD